MSAGMGEGLGNETWGRGVGKTSTGGQIGAVRKQDRGFDTRVGVGESLISPVLLAHHGLCSRILENRVRTVSEMFTESNFAPSLFKCTPSLLKRSCLLEKRVKLLI